MIAAVKPAEVGVLQRCSPTTQFRWRGEGACSFRSHARSQFTTNGAVLYTISTCRDYKRENLAAECGHSHRPTVPSSKRRGPTSASVARDRDLARVVARWSVALVPRRGGAPRSLRVRSFPSRRASHRSLRKPSALPLAPCVQAQS